MIHRKPLLPILLLLLTPMMVMAQKPRPYTGRVLTEYTATIPVDANGMFDAKNPVAEYTGVVEDWGTFHVVSPSHVITNWHVVHEYVQALEDEDDTAAIKLFFFNGKTTTDVEVLGTQRVLDLAVLQVNTTMPDGVHRVAIADELEAETLTGAGFQYGKHYREVVADSFDLIQFTPYFTFKGVAVVGQSGGPILDETGKLVGVIWGSDYPEEELVYGTGVAGVRWMLTKYAPEVLKLKGN